MKHALIFLPFGTGRGIYLGMVHSDYEVSKSTVGGMFVLHEILNPEVQDMEQFTLRDDYSNTYTVGPNRNLILEI